MKQGRPSWQSTPGRPRFAWFPSLSSSRPWILPGRGEKQNMTWTREPKGMICYFPNDPNVFVELSWTICSAHFGSHSSWIVAHECAWLTPRSSVRKRRFKHMLAASWSGSCSPPSQGYEKLRGHHYVRYCMGTTETRNQLWFNDSTDYSTLLLVQGIGMISMLYYPASSEPCSEKKTWSTG